MLVLYAFIGGGIGAALRYLLTVSLAEKLGTAFPYGTLAANTFGSLCMGFLMGILLILAERYGAMAESIRVLLAVGVLGGFTTLSSMSFETVMLWRGGNVSLALSNIGLNVGLGLLLAWIGLCAARFVLR